MHRPETPNPPPALHIEAVDEVVHYDDLCGKCKGVCRDYLRKMDGRTPLRRRPSADVPVAPLAGALVAPSAPPA